MYTGALINSQINDPFAKLSPQPPQPLWVEQRGLKNHEIVEEEKLLRPEPEAQPGTSHQGGYYYLSREGLLICELVIQQKFPVFAKSMFDLISRD